ncbi:MAG: hypothetical protein JWN70_6786 [Planctomycetaceae bacterium]|nr:hypothetical protein [Planctomycetaceae bacterium]
MSYQDDNYRDNPSDPQSDRDRYDDRYQDDRDRDERERTGVPGVPGQPPKKGCSKGCLYGAAGCGCLSLLVFIALGFGFYKFVELVINGTSVDPAVVRAATQEMIEVNPPAGLEPKLKLDVAMAKLAVYQSDDGTSTLSILQIAPWLDQKDVKKNREFGDSFRISYGDGGHDIEVQQLTISKTAEKDIKIRGQNCKVRIAEAKNAAGDEYRVIDTDVQGKVGPVQIQLQLPLKEYDEAEVTKFLESIK